MPQSLPNFNQSQNRGPVYLLTVEHISGVIEHYLCSKIDKHESFVDMIGVQHTNVIPDTATPHSLLVKEKLVEMSFPWSKIVSIRNLTYKAK